MNSFQEKTLKFLAESDDPAALELLRPLMDSSDWDFRRFAFDGLYTKGDTALYIELFRYFSKDPVNWKKCPAVTPERLGKIVVNALRSEELTLIQHAAKVVQEFRVYEALGAYVAMLEGIDLDQAKFAAQEISRLGEMFYEDLKNAPPSERTNLDRKRQWFTAELDGPVKHYSMHGMDEPIRALLLVTRKDYETFQNVTRDIHSAACKRLMEILESDTNPGFYRLLLSFVIDGDAPAAMDSLIVKKTEPQFVRNLLLTIGPKVSDTDKKALKRFKDFAWMDLPPETIKETIGDQDIPFIHLITSMTLTREKLLAMFAFVFKNLGVDGRRLAAESLKQYPGDDFNNLMLEACTDEDSQVVATFLRILKGRQAGNVDQVILKCTERNDQLLNNTICELMPEYRIEGLIQRMSSLTERGARELGAIVGKVDPNTRKVIENELGSYVGVRRQVAIDCVRFLGYGVEYEKKIIALAESDSETAVRVTAFKALSEILTKDVVMALRTATTDKSLAIREASTDALKNWMERYQKAVAGAK